MEKKDSVFTCAWRVEGSSLLFHKFHFVSVLIVLQLLVVEEFVFFVKLSQLHFLSFAEEVLGSTFSLALASYLIRLMYTIVVSTGGEGKCLHEGGGLEPLELE